MAELHGVPDGEIEALVLDALRDLLIDQTRLMDQLGVGLLRPEDLDHTLLAGAQVADTLKTASAHEQRSILQAILTRVEIAAEQVTIGIDAQALWSELGAPGMVPARPAGEERSVELHIPIRLARRGSELKLVLAERQPLRRDRNLIGRLAQGFLWFEELRTGAVASLAEIADREGTQVTMVRRACDLAFLSSDVIEAILAGEQPVELNSETFKLHYPLPIGSEEQRRVLGFSCRHRPPTITASSQHHGPPPGGFIVSEWGTSDSWSAGSICCIRA